MILGSIFRRFAFVSGVGLALYLGGDDNTDLSEKTVLGSGQKVTEERPESMDSSIAEVGVSRTRTYSIDPDWLSEHAGYCTWVGHNIALRSIGEDWRNQQSTDFHYDPATYDDQQLFFYKNRESNHYFELYAEKFFFGSDFNAEHMRLELEQLIESKKGEILETRHWKIGNLDWEVTLATREFNHKPVCNVYYRTFCNGIAYRGIYWVQKRSVDNESFFAAARPMIERLELIDPYQITFGLFDPTLGAWKSERYGISVDDRNHCYLRYESPWDPREVAELCLLLPLPESGSVSFVGICPYALPPGIKVNPDAILSSLGRMTGRMFHQLPGIQRKVVEGAGFPTTQYTERSTNDPNAPGLSIYRVIRMTDSVLLIRLSMQKEEAGAEAAFDRFLSKMEIEDSVPLPPRNEGESLAQALFLNGLGLYYNDHGNPNKALELFSAANQLVPTHAVILGNLAMALGRGRYFDRIIALYENQKEHLAELPLLQHAYGFSLYQTGRSDEAIEIFDQMIDKGTLDLGGLTDDFNALMAIQRYEVLMNHLERAASLLPSENVIKWRSVALKAQGKLEEAEQNLWTLGERLDWDLEAGSIMVDILLTEQKRAEALAQVERMEEEIGPGPLKYLRGLCLFHLKQFYAAREALQEAVEMEPQNANARQFLTHVSNMLGETDTSLFSAEIPAVPLVEVVKRDLPPPDLSHFKDSGATGLRVGDAVVVKQGRPARRTRYASFQVYDQTALLDLKELTIPFNPLNEKLFVNRLDVYGADGALVASADPATFYLSDQDRNNIVDEKKELHIPIPGLVVGGRYELVVTRENHSAEVPLLFSEFTLGGYYPRQESFLQVTGDLDLVDWHANSEDMSFSRSDEFLLWKIEWPQNFEKRIFLPAYQRYMPTVWINHHEVESWKALGRTYCDEIRDHLNVNSDAIREIADSLNPVDESVAAKVAAVSNLLSQQFNYVALLFGTRARIPRKVDTILESKYGDCKDHSLLAYHLLRAMDVEVYPALIHTAHVFVEDMPSLDQFNHMLLYVPDLRPSRLYDPTDRHLRSGLPPRVLGDQPLLVLNPIEPFLYYGERTSKDSNLARIDRSVTLSPDGDILVDESILLDGNLAAFFRDQLESIPPREYAQAIQSMIQSMGQSLPLRKVEITGLHEIGQEVEVKYAYKLQGLFQADKEGLRGRLPVTWDKAFFQFTDEPAARGAPISIMHPVRVTSHTRLNFPDGFTPAGPLFDGAFVTHSIFGTVDRSRADIGEVASSFNFEFSAELDQGYFAGDTYAALRSYLDTLSEECAPLVAFRPPP